MNPEELQKDLLALNIRLSSAVKALEVLGHLVKLQGERIDKLEDRLKAAEADGY